MSFRSFSRAGVAFAAALSLSVAVPALADHHGSKPQTTIVEAAAANDSFTSLVAAVKAAGLVDTLSGAGPFTVFAPVNSAFAALPAGTVDTLLKPESRPLLTKVLTYHVVAGKVYSTDLVKAIKDNGGSYKITTVSGGTLTATLAGDAVKLTDEKGGLATVTAVDLKQKNGVIHVIDTVLMPN